MVGELVGGTIAKVNEVAKDEKMMRTWSNTTFITRVQGKGRYWYREDNTLIV